VLLVVQQLMMMEEEVELEDIELHQELQVGVVLQNQV
jgi:hypothetical protein